MVRVSLHTIDTIDTLLLLLLRLMPFKFQACVGREYKKLLVQ